MGISVGAYIHNSSRGILADNDNKFIQMALKPAIRKSIGCDINYGLRFEDIADSNTLGVPGINKVNEFVSHLCSEVARRMEEVKELFSKLF